MVFIWKNEDVPWQFTGGYRTSFDINKGMQHARFVLKIRLWKIDTVPLCVWTFGTLKYDPHRMHFDIKLWKAIPCRLVRCINDFTLTLSVVKTCFCFWVSKNLPSSHGEKSPSKRPAAWLAPGCRCPFGDLQKQWHLQLVGKPWLQATPRHFEMLKWCYHWTLQ